MISDPAQAPPGEAFDEEADAPAARVTAGADVIVRTRGGRFAPGFSGNPRGPRPGVRRKAAMVADAVLREHAKQLAQAAVARALAGDVGALKLSLDRVAPVDRRRWVDLGVLPEIRTLEDVAETQAAIMRGTVAGDLALEDAQSLTALLDSLRQSIRDRDIGARLERLERARELTADVIGEVVGAPAGDKTPEPSTDDGREG